MSKVWLGIKKSILEYLTACLRNIVKNHKMSLDICLPGDINAHTFDLLQSIIHMYWNGREERDFLSFVTIEEYGEGNETLRQK